MNIPGKILFVDDDQHFLSSIRRNLSRTFELEFAHSPQLAMEQLQQQPFAVVISDMKMPGLTGVELLSRIREDYPDTVRILLTGYADQNTAIQAVNHGQVFSFLTKPCAVEQLTSVVTDALRQYQLVMAERELLEKTLLGTIDVMAQMVALVNPAAQRRANRLKHYCRQLAISFHRQDLWFYEMVAMLSQIGCLTVPGSLLDDYLQGNAIRDEERALVEQHPVMAAELLRHIPRLEDIAQAISLQAKPYRAFLSGPQVMVNEKIALAAQFLHTALEFDCLLYLRKQPFHEVVNRLTASPDDHNPQIVAVLELIEASHEQFVPIEITAQDLTAQMRLVEDVYTKSGVLLAARDQDLNDFLLVGIRNYARTVGIREPFTVLAPPAAIALLKQKTTQDRNMP